MKEYRLRKKWHMKLTRLQSDLVDGMGLTSQEQDTVTDLTLHVQEILARRTPGKPTNKEKREHIIGLALANDTLSMSAIARHVGCSEPLVAKVFNDRQQWDKRDNWRKP